MTRSPAADEVTRRVISRAQLDETTDTVPLPQAGLDYADSLGLMRNTLSRGRTAWGHSGDIEGFHPVLAKALWGPTVAATSTQSPPSR